MHVTGVLLGSMAFVGAVFFFGKNYWANMGSASERMNTDFQIYQGGPQFQIPREDEVGNNF